MRLGASCESMETFALPSLIFVARPCCTFRSIGAALWWHEVQDTLLSSSAAAHRNTKATKEPVTQVYGRVTQILMNIYSNDRMAGSIKHRFRSVKGNLDSVHFQRVAV